MSLITNVPTRPDLHTGAVRLDLWSEPADGGAYGDIARGMAYSARYLGPQGFQGFCAEIAVYVVEGPDGTFGVEEMVTLGKAVVEDGVPRPDDSAETEYEWADYRVYDTEEEAQRACDRLGRTMNHSFALNL